MSQVIYFKFYDTRAKKFVPPLTPSTVSDARYKLEIWANCLPSKHLNRLYTLSKKEKHHDLYVKIKNKYVEANKKNIRELMGAKGKSKKGGKKTQKKNKTRKTRRS